MSSVAEKKTLDYTVDFPKLPDATSVTSTSSSSAPTAAWNGGGGATQPAIKSSVITEAFKLSAEERASRGFSRNFGSATEEQQKCNQIAQATGTKIELNEAKDQSITILITGKQKNVEEARTRLVRELQTQATTRIEIPKEYHSYIIGKQGTKLRQLEKTFLCRIHMPNRDEQSDVIRIVGPNEYIMEAAKHIKAISDEMAKQKTENVEIPRSFYVWIRGLNNEKLDDLIRRTGVKINIPPNHANNDTIIISGDREGVETASAEIKAIYQEKKDTVVTVEINVKKCQHKFIIGRKRQGLDEIFRESEVIVELPPEEVDSEKILLRGPQDKIGDALSSVYHRASSTISAEISYLEWMRRHLIGPKGANLNNLVPNHEKLRIDFKEGLIYLEGAPEQVDQAKQQLLAEISRLDNEFCFEVMHVAPSLHRHVIGRSGAVVNKLKEEYDVQISVPNENSGSDQIRLEGKKENVEKVRETILDMVSKQQKKAEEDIERRNKQQQLQQQRAQIQQQQQQQQQQQPRSEPPVHDHLDVDPKHHRHFIIRGAEVLRKIQSQCGNCQISFPKQETGLSTVALRGLKHDLEEAKKQILAFVEELESKVQLTLKLDQSFYPRLIGTRGQNLRKMEEEFGVEIEMPNRNSTEQDLIVVTGKDEQRVKDCVEKMRAMEEDPPVQEELDVDPKHHRHFIVRGAEVLREIQSQCGNCQISFPKQETGSSSVALRGYKNDVEAAKKRILAFVEDLESKVHITLKLDQRFHPRLIGTRGRNLRKVEEEFGVEIDMPNRNGDEPDLVVVSGKDEQRVLDCVDKLRVMEEDYIGDLVDRNQYMSRREEPPAPKPPNQDIEIKGAPWQLDSLEQFPSIGCDAGNAAAGPAATAQKPVVPLGGGGRQVWGIRR